MKKLAYLFPAVIALGFAGCTDDPTGTAETEADTEDGTTGVTDPTVTPTEPSTTTDPTIDPDTGSESSTTDGPVGCTPDDACTPDTVEADCGANFNCLGCLCVPDGDAPLCPEGWGDGEYLDCLEGGNGVCTSTDLTPGCLVDNLDTPSAGVCFYQGCENVCDCPAPPTEAFEDQVACDDITNDGIGDCVIECGDCPEAMFCDGGVCLFGEAPGDTEDYGDCVNQAGPCENGICLLDDTDSPAQGICSPDCKDVDGDTDCPDPDTGDATPDCVVVDAAAGITSCILPCDEATVCPDSTICGAFGFCTHALPPESGYADCASQPDNVCLANETCIENIDKATGTTEICAAADCVDPATDCPDAPATGDAPVACQDIDGAKGDECVLDCSAAQTCPDGAVCTEAGFCSYELPTFTFEEDFEGGVLPAGWTVQNVDGLVPAVEVAVIDDAWVISDILDGPNFSAVSTSWYTPEGQSDDWIISPAITLAATATLSWNARARDANPMFADGYEVYVVPSTVTEFTDFIESGDPTAFLALNAAMEPSVTPVFEVASESPDLQWHTEDLAAVVSQEVFVAFRNNFDDGNLLRIDNIWVTE